MDKARLVKLLLPAIEYFGVAYFTMNSDFRFHSLDADKISLTIERLSQRIEERFPGSGLSALCGQLLTVSRHAKERAAWIARPIIGLRLAAAALIALIVAAFALSFLFWKKPAGEMDITQFVSLLESAIQDVIFLGLAILFLATIEVRLKRGRALKALHELRAIAHIIDMHQLTKDPEGFFLRGETTPSSPTRSLTNFELNRYLDYCSEMLSLTGKIAALYVQQFDDSVALAAVNEIEAMTTGLSNKIWQKINILHEAERFHQPPG